MKKQNIRSLLEQIRLEKQEDSHAVRIAKDRYEQAERILRQSERLLHLAESKLRDVDTTRRAAEKIEADTIDIAATREAVRYVAMCIGVEETSPGRFVGGYEAIIARIRTLLDAEEKVGLLTAFYNAQRPELGAAQPDGFNFGLAREASFGELRRRIVAMTRDVTVPARVRDILLLALSENRPTTVEIEVPPGGESSFTDCTVTNTPRPGIQVGQK